MKTLRQDLLAELQKEMAQVQAQLKPVLAVTAETAADKVWNEIAKSHTDARDLYPALTTWIDTQPGVSKRVYNAILDEGSVTDVVELYDAFKTATGKPAAAAPPETPALTAEEEADKARRLKLMEGAGGRRSGVSGEEDKNDFSGAFAAAVKEVK